MYSSVASILFHFTLITTVFSAPAPQAPAQSGVPSVEGSPGSFPALTDNSKIPALQLLGLGTLPNGPAPPAGAVSAEGITNLQLIELNEFFEAAFFLSLLNNITSNVPGFEIVDPEERTWIIDSLVAIIAVSVLFIYILADCLDSYLILCFTLARRNPRHLRRQSPPVPKS
jgi:hypothetical protein